MYKTKSKILPFEHEYDDGKIIVYEYGGLNSDMDLAVAQVIGNYPGSGKFAVNTKVETMTYFVATGKGIFRFEDGEEHYLSENDCVFITKNRGYQVEVEEGEILEILMVSNKAWTPDQQVLH